VSGQTAWFYISGINPGPLMAKDRCKDENWYYSFLPYNISAGSTNALIPLFITEGLKGTVAQVGLISAATSLASVPGNILWGNLSDTTKKRAPFILIGFLGMALSLILMGFTSGMGGYFVANFLFGIMGAAIAPVGTVLVLECFRKEEWAKRLGHFSRIGGMGWVLGLLVGTMWLLIFPSNGDSAPMRSLFILSGALCLISVFLGWKYMPEPSRTVERKELHRLDLYKVPLFVQEKLRFMPQRLLYVVEMSSKNLNSRNFPKALKRYYIVVFLAFTGFLGFYVALPTYLSQYVGISSAQVMAVYLASAVVSAFTYVAAGRYVHNYGGRKAQSIAYVGRILIFPSFFLVTLLPLDLTSVFIVMCALNGLSGYFWAMFAVASDSLVAKMSYNHFRSQSMGMFSSVKGISTIIGSITGGLIAQYLGYLALFIMSSVFVIIALAMLAFTDVEKEPDDSEQPAIVVT